MAQVLFFSRRPGEIRWKVFGSTFTFRSLIVAAVECSAQSSVANNNSRYKPRLDAEQTPFHYLCPECRRVNWRQLATSPFHLVTSALQACNVKNIFAEKLPCKSATFSNYACNVVDMASIFRKNTSLSYAIDDFTDHLMLNKKTATNVPYGTFFVEGNAHPMTRDQSAFQRRFVSWRAS